MRRLAAAVVGSLIAPREVVIDTCGVPREAETDIGDREPGSEKTLPASNFIDQIEGKKFPL